MRNLIIAALGVAVGIFAEKKYNVSGKILEGLNDLSNGENPLEAFGDIVGAKVITEDYENQ